MSKEPTESNGYDFVTDILRLAQAWAQEDREKLGKLDLHSLPVHVAVIMDGNGRWAKQHGFLDRVRGHEYGIDSVRETITTCAQLSLKCLTLYAFSKENWRRPVYETNALMKMLARFLVDERVTLMENNIRLTMIGDADDLPSTVKRTLDDTIALTSGNTGLRLMLALSYGGRDELIRAVKKMLNAFKEGRLLPESLDEATFSSFLDASNVPDPDLLIRTSGEQRISNFLLWQIAYAELYITEVLWPDFRRSHLLDAFLDYQRRERRYGTAS